MGLAQEPSPASHPDIDPDPDLDNDPDLVLFLVLNTILILTLPPYPKLLYHDFALDPVTSTLTFGLPEP
jgi:hypothetical protein